MTNTVFPSTKSRSRHPGVYIAVYCSTTIVMLFFNKWLFTHIPEFHFVLTITWLQQFGVMVLIFCLRHFLTPVLGTVRLSSILFLRILPVGAIAALDFAFSNLALQALPMTIYEIVKSCAPAVVLVLSISLGLIKPSWKLTGVVAVIVIGAVFGVYRPSNGEEEKSFEYIGLMYIVLATLCAASKSVAAQVALQGNKAKMPKHRRSILRRTTFNSNVTSPNTKQPPVISSASPNSPVGLAPALPTTEDQALRSYGASDEVESSRVVRQASSFAASSYSDLNESTIDVEDLSTYDRYGPINPATVAFVCAVVTVVIVMPFAMVREYHGLREWMNTIPLEQKGKNLSLVFLGSTLSVIANVCSFFVMRETSALTYALVGVCQRAMTVITAVVVLHEAMPPWAIAGFSLTMCGILTYNRISLHAHHHHSHKSAKSQRLDEGERTKSEVTPLFPMDTKTKESFGSGRSIGPKTTSRIQFSMATTCADSLYLPALESHSDDSSSSSDEELILRTTGRYFL